MSDVVAVPGCLHEPCGRVCRRGQCEVTDFVRDGEREDGVDRLLAAPGEIADAVGEDERYAALTKTRSAHADFSPDERWVAYASVDPANGADLKGCTIACNGAQATTASAKISPTRRQDSRRPQSLSATGLLACPTGTDDWD